MGLGHWFESGNDALRSGAVALWTGTLDLMMVLVLLHER